MSGVTIYLDLNNNGVLDNDEPHAVTMEDDTNTSLDESGRYWLNNLDPGNYFVREVVPDGFLQTFPNPLIWFDPATGQPGDPDLRPIIFPVGAHFVNLGSGQRVEGIDFGNQPIRPGSIHGIKWLDRNGNAERDPDEPGLPGVTIYADLNSNGVLDDDEPHAVTMENDPASFIDESGRYWLNGLDPGNYVIREVVPDGFAQTFPFGPIALPAQGDPNDLTIFPPFPFPFPGAHFVTVGSGQVVEGIDFGNQRIEPGSVHGLKWLDSNSDGKRNYGEPGFPGVTIYADLNFNGELDPNEPQTKTMEDIPETDFDEAGRYWLDGLRPGFHAIREVVPEGFVQTFPRLFFTPVPLPDPILVNELSIFVPPGSHLVSLQSGGVIEGLDFGNRLLGDANFDGKVTGQDIIIVQQNFGNTPGTVAGSPPLFGDANGDGKVTGADILSVIRNYAHTVENQGGPTNNGNGTAVPVPTARRAAVIPTSRSNSGAPQRRGLLDAADDNDPVDILALLDPSEN